MENLSLKDKEGKILRSNRYNNNNWNYKGIDLHLSQQLNYLGLVGTKLSWLRN
jgi:hypothetical protein